ncbi:ferredoxin [Streptomyces virginiae]|uniref:ferredoxin n=1 Tax=Streptomyces virginiae TaxID=1961 RepID=UPI003656D0F7
MRIVVDLNRCQGYAQCVYLAHEVFRLSGQEAPTYEPNPDRHRRCLLGRAAGRGSPA